MPSRASGGRAQPERGAYMMSATPTRHTAAPATSQRSGRKPSTAIPQSSEPATKPHRPRATTPAPAHTQPRCSRTPCQMSQAPPISARAASTKSAMERATVTGLIVAPARAASGGASEVAGRAPLLVAAQDAELGALGVAHDDPATAVLGAAVLDDGGSERLDTSDLLVARTVGRAQVE